VKTIFAILMFVLFLLPGAYLAGFAAAPLAETQRFESPDQHAEFMQMIEFGVTFAVGLLGAVVGVVIGGWLRPVFFRKSS
jgi:ascorbate-specific PTS system EIIC-type component UlaA